MKILFFFREPIILIQNKKKIVFYFLFNFQQKKMLINKILKTDLQYKQIDDYVNLFAFLIASWASFISIYNFENYLFVYRTLVIYFGMDILFVPFYKKDVFLHHILIVCLLTLGLDSSREFHNVVTKVLLQTEISSIVLSPANILKKYQKKNKNLKIFSMIFNFIFIILFLYFRIFNLTFYFFFDERFFLILQEKKNTEFLIGIIFLSMFLFLNYYWLYKIHCFITKKKMITNKK